MGLNKRRIGSMIRVIDERNAFGYNRFYGININKEFMPTVADTNGLDASKYKVVRKGRFVFSGMQTGRDECIRISVYLEDDPIIVSPAYTTFEVIATNIIDPTYLFMLFLSSEMDRLGWFYSDGSIRSNLDWDRFCDIEINLPPLPIQQKYVAIYKAMVVNQQSYERGLEDLRLSFGDILDQIKKTEPYKTVGDLLQEIDERNTSGNITNVQGINITKQFMPSVADTNGVNLKNYKVVRTGQFAYSGMQTGRDECIRIAYYTGKDPIIISPAYTVFVVNKSIVLPEFIMMWFSREQSDRRGWFMSDSSIRTNLDLERFYEMMIPLPDMETQRSIVKLYIAFITRRRICESLKSQIRDICPILIKGSREEGR